MNNNPDNFIQQYLSYVGETECPTFYHRWCCISMVATYLERTYWFPNGHSIIYPNMYIMLLGPPGARKSTAIKVSKKVIAAAGYTRFSAEKTSKEKFLLDLAGEESTENVLDNILDTNLWGETTGKVSEMYVACDEFNDFIGTGNVEFISLLGSLWDFRGVYINRIKTGKSVAINDPTINILGGNTPTNFAKAFPPEIMGQGFFSRLILVHGTTTGKRITFPVAPADSDKIELVKSLHRIKTTVTGKAVMGKETRELVDKLYKTYKGVDDVRFESYSQRRFDNFIKLCLVISACEYSSEILPKHVVEANTILTHTEYFMPTALGEFGKSRNSDVTHKLMQILLGSYNPVTLTELWQHLHKDLDKLGDLTDIVKSMHQAGRIMMSDKGFLAVRKVAEQEDNDLIDYSYLTLEEREMKK
jgi:hypothetical protein